MNEYKQGNIRFLHVDNMEYMATVPDKYFDLAIVDPPYRDENNPTTGMKAFGSMGNFGKRPTIEYHQELCRVSKNQIIWGANNFNFPPYKGFVVWEKETIGETFTMSMAEIASLSEGLATTSKIYKIRPQDSFKIHPTQKPRKLYDWLLTTYAKPGQKVIDTHLGSGSSAISAHYFGVSEFVGCELDVRYFNSSIERFKLETAQKQLFSTW